MIALWWAKVQAYVIAAGALLLAIGGGILYVFGKGKIRGEAKGATAAAEQKANTAAAIVSRIETRANVDSQVASLPSNPVVKPTVPAPLPVSGSAADRLQSEWSRD